jgi:hypothetical protein
MKEKDKKFVVKRKIVRSTTFASYALFAFFNAQLHKASGSKEALKLSINFRI